MPSNKKSKSNEISLKSGKFISRTFYFINKDDLDAIDLDLYPEEAKERWKKTKILEYESRQKWDDFSLKERRTLLKNINGLTNEQTNEFTYIKWEELPSEVRAKIKQYYS